MKYGEICAYIQLFRFNGIYYIQMRLRVLWNGIRFSTENFPTAYCDKVSCGILYLFLTGPCDGNNSRTPQKQLNYIKHNYPTRYGRRLLLLPVFRPLISNLY